MVGYLIYMPFNKFFVLLILFFWTMIIVMVAARFLIKVLEWLELAFVNIHKNIKLQESHFEATKGIVSILEIQKEKAHRKQPQPNQARMAMLRLPSLDRSL